MLRIFSFFAVLCASSFTILAQDTTRLSLLFLGDIMQHDSQIADAWDPNSKQYDYRPCFKFVKPYTEAVDVAIGNLELTLAGPPYKGYPQFGAPDELLVALKEMGMDVLVTANNHCVDRGRKGLERTIEMLDSMEILHTGTFVDEVERLNLTPLMIEKNGFRIALLNYTYGTNGLPVHKPNIVNMLDKSAIEKDLAKSRELKPDMIIVFTHWGTEYQSLPSAFQKDLAAFLIKNGADIVVGAHPHVVQPMEWYKNENRLIAYSLGNFVSGQRKRYTDGGAMLRLELEKVTMNNQESRTTIDTAGYILQWVYRTNDQQKNYFVYPIPSLGTNTSQYIFDPASREAYSTFVTDSRALFGKYNLNIQEFRDQYPLTRPWIGGKVDNLNIDQSLDKNIRSFRDHKEPDVDTVMFDSLRNK
jgi:poly-gamma-glutamate capsule biosynthesis protein CapA/YwtB (metallophosphatase superfamily)